MEILEKKIKFLSWFRWMGFGPAIIIYLAAYGVFSRWICLILFAAFALGFYNICNSERKKILCDNIVGDIRKALNRVGQNHAVFELKSMKIGIVVRVYLIRARQKSPVCNKAVVESISNGWYRPYICATQIVDLDSENDIREAQDVLNEDLLKDIQERIAKEKGKRE